MHWSDISLLTAPTTLSLSKEICTGARTEKSWIFASLHECDCFCWHEVDYFGILMVDSLPVEKAVWRLPTPERQRSRHGLVETHARRYPHCHEGLDDHFSKIPHQPPCSADLLVVNHPSSGAVNCKATLPIRWCYLCYIKKAVKPHTTCRWNELLLLMTSL